MRCRYCRDRAGLLRRECDQCRELLALYERHRGELGLSQLLDVFIATGASRAKIEAVLASDPDGDGALRDRITADMANRLLAHMGVTPRHTAADVKRLRERESGSVSTSRPAGDVLPPTTRRP
jgi:hypothetical protein